MNKNSWDFGQKGEAIAADLCREKNYIIIEKNYRTPAGEIDIIAKDGDVFVFIEVKARSGIGYGAPYEAVTQQKRNKIRKAALSYIRRFRKEVPCRFDVISIQMKNGRPEAEHIIDAFEV
jgi:putative endonuclease